MSWRERFNMSGPPLPRGVAGDTFFEGDPNFQRLARIFAWLAGRPSPSSCHRPDPARIATQDHVDKVTRHTRRHPSSRTTASRRRFAPGAPAAMPSTSGPAQLQAQVRPVFPPHHLKPRNAADLQHGGGRGEKRLPRVNPGCHRLTRFLATAWPSPCCATARSTSWSPPMSLPRASMSTASATSSTTCRPTPRASAVPVAPAAAATRAPAQATARARPTASHHPRRPVPDASAPQEARLRVHMRSAASSKTLKR